MLLRVLPLAALAVLTWSASTEAQTFVSIPGTSYVSDITPDGSILVGSGSGGGFYWRWKVDPAPTYIGGNGAVGVSDDGTVIVGDITDPVLNAEVAARWTEATGWQSLGYLPNALSCPSRSSAYDVSGDGSTVVGLSWDGCNGRGFRWTAATGMQELQPLANGQNRTSAISGDGSAAGGFAQGNFSRTPAYWLADTSGFTLDENSTGEVYGFNEDGSQSVGTMTLGGTFGTAYVRDRASGVITNLGALKPTQMVGIATDISEDGKTIVGFDNIQLSRQAWIWTESDGIISLTDRLTALGVPNAPSAGYVCTAVSDDGNVVVGIAAPGFFGSGFVAELADAPWVNLGGGSPGIEGIPYLAGSGTLVGGTPAGLKLTQAPLFTLALAWVSFAPTPLAAFGGTIHTHPYNKQFLFLTSNGEVNINTTWPVGLPPGTEAWFQFLLSDPSVIYEITLSNGLKAITP